MNLAIITISVFLIVTLLWIGSGNETKEPVVHRSMLSPREISYTIPNEEPENISIPRKFRRAQASLLRQSNAVVNNMKELHRQGQVVEIASQLAQVGTQHVALQDAMLDLKSKDIEITTKQHEVDLSSREELLAVNQARTKLEYEMIDAAKLKALNESQSEILKVEAKTLDLARAGLTIDDKLLDLRSSKLDLVGKENDISNKMLDLRNSKLDLISKENDISGKMLDLKDKKLGLKSYKIDIDQRLIDVENSKLDVREYANKVSRKERLQEYKEKEMALDKKSIDLGREIIKVDLGNLMNQRKHNLVDYKDQLNKLNSKEVLLSKHSLDNIKGEIANKRESVELSKKDVRLTVLNGLNLLHEKHLSNKKGELLNLRGQLTDQEHSLRLAKKDLVLTYELNNQKFVRLLSDIKAESRSLKLQRRENKLKSGEEMLSLKEYRVNSLRRHLSQMYEVRSNWLRIQARENNLDYREEQLKLDKRYHQTQRQLERLRLYRQENNLIYREQKLELKNLLSDLQNDWRWRLP
jgi:hypothetical protein